MSARKAKAGKTNSMRPPEGQQWFWMTKAMLGSRTFQALPLNARRILDFLIYENVSHAGTENGRLGATYAQLNAWGCTNDDIRRGLEALYVTGFVDLTYQGHQIASGGEFSRYGLTWLPTVSEAPGAPMNPPTHRWLKVIERLSAERVTDARATRAWIKLKTEHLGRGWMKREEEKRTSTPQMRAA